MWPSGGITSVQNMGTWVEVDVFERVHQVGRLRTLISAAVPLDTRVRRGDTVGRRGRGDAWLRVGSLKGCVNGSLGSHTAAFAEPFTDAPGDNGLLVNTPEALYRRFSSADAEGLQVMAYAIGDRAIRVLLDLFARVAAENGPRDRRFRTEYVQHIAPEDLKRFAT